MKPLYAASLIFGILAAVLSGVHGVGEVMQDGSPDGIMINAWGSPISGEGPCMDANNPDGGMCFPAMTILTFLPFSIVGILTIFFSIVLLIMTVSTYRGGEKNVPDVPNTAPPPFNKIPYKRGQHIAIGSILVLLIGGGFLAPILGLVSVITRYLGSR
tara:strand:+ start:119 stop:592 length:474 start_codon:yes stop_codon:yes gene_type:complete